VAEAGIATAASWPDMRRSAYYLPAPGGPDGISEVSRRQPAADFSAMTIKGFELLGADSKISTLNKVRRALEQAGVEFIDDSAHSYEGGPGVRLRGTKGKR
jgi:hypothetical protein